MVNIVKTIRDADMRGIPIINSPYCQGVFPMNHKKFIDLTFHVKQFN